MKALKLLLWFFSTVGLCACWQHASPEFSSDPKVLEEYLGVRLPNSVKSIKMVAEKDRVRVVLQAKIEISEEAFDELALALKMTPDHDATVPKGFLFRETFPGEWWNPPEAFEQIKLGRGYGGKIHYPNSNYFGDIIMIWMEGTAYIYKFGP